MLLNVSGPNNLCSGKLKAVGIFRGGIKPAALIIVIVIVIIMVVIFVTIMVIRKTWISGDILDLEISPRHHCYTCEICLIKLFVILIIDKIKSNNDHLDMLKCQKRVQTSENCQIFTLTCLWVVPHQNYSRQLMRSGMTMFVFDKKVF